LTAVTRWNSFTCKSQANRGESDTQPKNHCTDSNVGSCDIGSFVAPNCPGAKQDLTANERDPPVREVLQRNGLTRMLADTKPKCDHTDRD
jgi:hypothetical protein